MPITTAKVLAKRVASSVRKGMYEICLFLTDQLAGFTGPGWTVVECDDTVTRVAGTFAGTNWAVGSGPPPAGSWCVLETLDANNSNHCQIYIQLSSDSNVNFKMIPLEDFATGGGSTGGADPTFPATSVGAGTSVVLFNSFPTAGYFSCIADEGMCAIIANNLTEKQWMYIGEVNPFHGDHGDDRAYVIWDSPSTVRWQTVTSFFNRLSPSDDTTILVSGAPSYFYIPNGIDFVLGNGYLSSEERGNILGSDPIWPIAVYFSDTSHKHDVGWLRNVFGVHTNLGREGVLGVGGNPDFYFFSNSPNGGLVFTWDGVTVA